jgi:hypothetical protein
MFQYSHCFVTDVQYQYWRRGNATRKVTELGHMCGFDASVEVVLENADFNRKQKKSGTGGGGRTHNLRFRRPLLYPLSYARIQSYYSLVKRSRQA